MTGTSKDYERYLKRLKKDFNMKDSHDIHLLRSKMQKKSYRTRHGDFDPKTETFGATKKLMPTKKQVISAQLLLQGINIKSVPDIMRDYEKKQKIKAKPVKKKGKSKKTKQKEL